LFFLIDNFKRKKILLYSFVTFGNEAMKRLERIKQHSSNAEEKEIMDKKSFF